MSSFISLQKKKKDVLSKLNEMDIEFVSTGNDLNHINYLLLAWISTLNVKPAK